MIGYCAADLVQSGMRVGLGTGSTAFFFVQRLIERCAQGLRIEAVASSLQVMTQARKGGIPLLDLAEIEFLDLTVDSADEIDSQKRMIKGGGGAHVREKIVASMSKEVIIIVDESKCVQKLGACKLPVEILSFAPQATAHRIECLGYHGNLRLDVTGAPFVTDNGNYIFDIHFASLRDNPEEDHEALIHLPGVVDTGFFFHLAHQVIIGYETGEIIRL